MSTKSSKKTVAASSSMSTSSSTTSSIQSPQPSTSTPIDRRPGSPLSPTRYSRLKEKQDLQNLNDRLAAYIEKVRHLETENSRLTQEITTSQEIGTREISNIRSMYDRELADVRKLLDDTSLERAKLEIDTKRLWDDNENLKAKLEKKKRELAVYNNLQSQYNQVQAEKRKLQERERELEEENEKLKTALEDTRKHLKEETLQRVDLENTIQSLKEDVSFKDEVHQKELSESRVRRQVEISEIDGRLAEQYEAKLQQSLHELRDQYEAQMRANREEIEMLYENKIKNLTSHVEELRQTRSRFDSLTQRISELETSNNSLVQRIKELETLRELERAKHNDSLTALETELARLRDEMAQQLQEYQDLMDIKVALDLEIAAYRKLLESEEARLNITPATLSTSSASSIPFGRTTPSRHTPIRGGKRKRTLMEESDERSSSEFSVIASSRSDVEITEADPQGKYVKLTNKGSKEIVLSGWQIIRKAGTLETIFKFHRTAKLEPGATVTVWSSDIGATHEPPSNLVMKGQKWFTSDSMTTSLVNNEGEEMANSERKRQQLSTSISRHRERMGFRASEDLHHQQGDPDGQERCSLM